MAEPQNSNRQFESQGREPRTRSLAARFTEAEASLLEERAATAGQPLGAWMRQQLLAAAAYDADPVFTELIAVRMLLNETLPLITRQCGMSTELFVAMRDRLYRTKHQNAREVMSQYTGPSRASAA